jgi:hypothetical protein
LETQFWTSSIIDKPCRHSTTLTYLSYNIPSGSKLTAMEGNVAKTEPVKIKARAKRRS